MVADEIKKLADDSKSSILDISLIAKDIIESTNNIVNDIFTELKDSEESAQNVNKILEIFKSILVSFEEILNNMGVVYSEANENSKNSTTAQAEIEEVMTVFEEVNAQSEEAFAYVKKFNSSINEANKDMMDTLNLISNQERTIEAQKSIMRNLENEIEKL